MSARAPAVQEYSTDANGRRYPMHTYGLGGACRCNACHQRRYWTPERRSARSAAVTLQYADGSRARTGDQNRRRPWCWTPEQDDALRALVGLYDCSTIARMLSDRFGYPRSTNAVKHRCQRLGLSRIEARPLSTTEVGRLFGITRETVRSRFVNPGRLQGTKRTGGPHGFLWFFTRADLERLIREHPAAYDVEKLRDPGLRALAIAVARSGRLLSTAEVAEATGIDTRTLAGWYARGLVPSARKVRGVLPGAGGAWLVPSGALDEIRSTPARILEQRRARAAARRDPLTGAFLASGEIPSPDLRCALRLIDRAEACARLRAVG